MGFPSERVPDQIAHDRQLISDVIEQLPVGLLVCDLEGTVSQINAQGRAILGADLTTCLDCPIADVLVPFETLLKVARDQDSGRRNEVKREGADGNVRIIGYSARFGEGALPVLVLFRDLTSIISLREERDRLLRMAMVGHILPSVLHELRNPLAAVTGTIENMLEEIADDGISIEEHEQTLSAVLHELQRMSLIFQGIGSVGRSFRGTRPEAIDRVLVETCRIMERQAKWGQVSLVCDVGPIPLLPLDLSVVRAVTFNLVNNALQACKPKDAVRVSASLDGEIFRLTVRDTGRGMNEVVQKQCLQPFFTTRLNGSGLGLVICRESVEESGGTLDIESQVGVGTTVTVRVPVIPRDDQ